MAHPPGQEPPVGQQSPHQESRQAWMAVLAKATPNALEKAVAPLTNLPSYRFLRSPETGLTMVRGRAGGTGQVFNLGEMTLTRCVIQLEESHPRTEEPITGFGYVGGRSHRHAELAALCDALLQHPDWHHPIYTHVIERLQADAEQRKETQQRQTEATRVNFFTLARAETLENS